MSYQLLPWSDEETQLTEAPYTYPCMTATDISSLALAHDPSKLQYPLKSTIVSVMSHGAFSHLPEINCKTQRHFFDYWSDPSSLPTVRVNGERTTSHEEVRWTATRHHASLAPGRSCTQCRHYVEPRRRVSAARTSHISVYGAWELEEGVGD